MHALEHESPLFARDRQNALHPEDIGASGLQQLAHPCVERRAVDLAIEFQGDRTDGVVVRVLRIEKMLHGNVDVRT